MKSIKVGNEEILTTTAAMKEDIQRDIVHLYALLDQCTDEDLLQQIRKSIRAALNIAEVNIIEASSRFSMLSNEPANKALSPQKSFFSPRKHCKIPSTKTLNQPTNKT